MVTDQHLTGLTGGMVRRDSIWTDGQSAIKPLLSQQLLIGMPIK